MIDGKFMDSEKKKGLHYLEVNKIIYVEHHCTVCDDSYTIDKCTINKSGEILIEKIDKVSGASGASKIEKYIIDVVESGWAIESIMKIICDDESYSFVTYDDTGREMAVYFADGTEEYFPGNLAVGELMDCNDVLTIVEKIKGRCRTRYKNILKVK